MSKDSGKGTDRRTDRKGRAGGGRLAPALCALLGVLILLCAAASLLPVLYPKLAGCGAYRMTDGSLGPEIPADSLLLVEDVGPDAVEAGDVILYVREGEKAFGRVETNRRVEGEYLIENKNRAGTKPDGEPDADAEADGEADEEAEITVSYGELAGRVRSHYPFAGILLDIYGGTIGRIYAACFAACGAMFLMLAGKLRRRRR